MTAKLDKEKITKITKPKKTKENLTIQEKLSDIQKRLIAPKNQVNKFGNYKYRSCEDILEALKPLLSEHSLSLIISDDMMIVGERIYVKATAVLHDKESTLTATGMAREPLNQKGMSDAQLTGAASSYARKYCLNGLFCIDDNKDADSTNTHGKENSVQIDKDAMKRAIDKKAKAIAEIKVLIFKGYKEPCSEKLKELLKYGVITKNDDIYKEAVSAFKESTKVHTVTDESEDIPQ